MAETTETRRWGRYESICEIASGGMASVYLARDTRNNRLAAVKSLHPHFLDQDTVLQHFRDETHIVSRLCHKNVVPITEFSENEQGEHYQVMEYVDGGPLGKLLVHAARSGHWISVPACVQLALDVLDGLHAAHELRNNAGELTGVVHRDVGPANILVDVYGYARLIDFGVATMAVRFTAPGSDSIKGRLAYMAPEQAQDPKNVDRRADLFAVGIVLWELLAAARLFKGTTEAATLTNLLELKIPPLSVIRDDLDLDLEAAIFRGLDRDREERFQTAQEFADALRAAVPEAERAKARDELAKLVGEAVGPELEVRHKLAEKAGAKASHWEELSRAQSWDGPSGLTLTHHGVDSLALAIPAPTRLAEPPPKKRRSSTGYAVLALLLALVSAFTVVVLTRSPVASENRTPASSRVAQPVAPAPSLDPPASVPSGRPLMASPPTSSAAAVSEAGTGTKPAARAPDQTGGRSQPTRPAESQPAAAPEQTAAPKVELNNPYR